MFIVPDSLLGLMVVLDGRLMPLVVAAVQYLSLRDAFVKITVMVVDLSFWHLLTPHFLALRQSLLTNVTSSSQAAITMAALSNQLLSFLPRAA